MKSAFQLAPWSVKSGSPRADITVYPWQPTAVCSLEKHSVRSTRCPTLTLYSVRRILGDFTCVQQEIVRCHMDSNSSYVWLFMAPVTEESKLQICLLPQGSALYIPALECSQSATARCPACLPSMNSCCGGTSPQRDGLTLQK